MIIKSCTENFSKIFLKRKRQYQYNTYRWKAVFIDRQKESWTHDFCIFSDAEQDKTPSEKKLALFKEAKLGKKKKVFPRNKNENFEHCKDVLYRYDLFRLHPTIDK